MSQFTKNRQYAKFCAYGFLKNLRFFDAFLLLFFIEKGLSFTQIGSLYAIREIVSNIFEIPSGILADTYGRKRALIGAFGAYIVCFALFYLYHDFYLFAVAIIMYGIGDAFRSGTHKGMIMDYLRLNDWEDQKVNYYGHTRSWSQRGSALSALVAGLLVFYEGNYQNIFLYSIFPYLLNFINIASYPKELNFSLQPEQQKRKLAGTSRDFLRIIKKPQLLELINSAAIHSAFMRAVKDYIQPVMLNVALLLPLLTEIADKKRSGLIIGLIYFMIYLMTASASQMSARLMTIKRFYIPRLTLILGFMSGMACGLFYFTEWWIPSLLAFVGIYLIENLRKPILTGAVADQVANDILTSVISAQNFLRTILTVLIAFLFGAGVDYFGIGPSLIGVSGILLLFTLGLSIIKQKNN